MGKKNGMGKPKNVKGKNKRGRMVKMMHLAHANLPKGGVLRLRGGHR